MTAEPAAELARAIPAHLTEWDSPVVELAIFGTADPGAIALAIERFAV